LYEQALLSEGGQLANAPEYVQRLNRLLVRLAAPQGAVSCTWECRGSRMWSARASPVPREPSRRSSRPP
jgi:hypothetical protein